MPHTPVFLVSAAIALTCATLTSQRILATMRGTAGSEMLGSMVSAVGDLDGDGVADFAVAASLTSTPRIHLCSGRNGSLLRTLSGPINEEWGESIADIGDVNADGVRDLAIGASGRRNATSNGAIELFSGRDGTLIGSVINPDSGTTLGRRILGIDDVDADGVPDFLATSPGGGGRVIHVFSGRTRASLRVIWFAGQSGSALDLAVLGDVNGDGVREVVTGDPGFNQNAGRAVIFDPRTGTVLRSMAGGPGQGRLGWSVAGAGDVDGDGTPDVAASAPSMPDAYGRNSIGAVLVYSGRTGGLLQTVAGPFAGTDFGISLAGLGDVNGDGVPDFAVGSSWRDSVSTDAGALWLASGLTGGILMHMVAPRPDGGFASVCAGIHDFDGDGIRDVLVGSPRESDLLWREGAVRIISGRLLAEATPEGAGCGGGPFVPMLGGTRPIVGTTALLVGEWPPLAPGFLLLSPPPIRPTNLGVPACNAYVDIATAIVLLPIAPGIGRWTLPMPVPSLPGFGGLELSFQVIYGPTSGPLGFDLTGGLRWRIGW